MFVAKRKHLFVLLLCLVLTLTIVSCGDEEEPTPTPAPPTVEPTAAPTDTAAPPPTDTPAPTATTATVDAAAAEAAQPESPLAPASPLATPAAGAQQPPSPLAEGATAFVCDNTVDATAGNGAIPVLADPVIIDGLVSALQVPEPQAGKAALSGLLYSYSVKRVIPGTQFYLTKGLEDGDNVLPPAVFLGPKEEQGDVLGFTDACGQLFLDNVPPGNYYLAVWTVYDWLLAFDTPEDAMPLLITLEAGDQLNLGKLEANWP